MSKSLDVFVGLSKRCLSPTSLRQLVQPSDYDEQIAFHRVYERLLAQAKTEKERSLMESRYPFTKVGGRWVVSMPAFWMFLQSARAAMARTGNPQMAVVYEAVRGVQTYIDEANSLWRELRPKDFENLQEYHEKLRRNHESMLTRQLELFSGLNVNRG